MYEHIEKGLEGILLLSTPTPIAMSNRHAMLQCCYYYLDILDLNASLQLRMGRFACSCN